MICEEETPSFKWFLKVFEVGWWNSLVFEVPGVKAFFVQTCPSIKSVCMNGIQPRTINTNKVVLSCLETIWLWYVFEAHLQILRFCQVLWTVDSFFEVVFLSKVEPLALVSTYDGVPICFKGIRYSCWNILGPWFMKSFHQSPNPWRPTHQKAKDKLH